MHKLLVVVVAIVAIVEMKCSKDSTSWSVSIGVLCKIQILL